MSALALGSGLIVKFWTGLLADLSNIATLNIEIALIYGSQIFHYICPKICEN